MRRTRLAPRTIRGSLLTLIAIALAPLVAFGVYDVLRDYRQQRDAEIRASAELARAVGSSFESYLYALVRTEHALAVSIGRHDHTPRQVQYELDGIQAEFPAVRDMSWIDPDGTAVASTEPQLVGKNFFARDYFQEISAGAEWRVSPLMRSVLDGAPVFIVARGHRSAGRLVGIVAAAIDARALDAVLAERSGGGATSLIDEAGTIVALQTNEPWPLDWEARRRIAAHPWVQRALSGSEAHGIFRSVLDGGLRIGATVPLPGIGWAVHASRPLAEALAPVRRAAAVHAAVLLAVALAALGAALFVGRKIAEPLRALEQHAGRLAANGPRPWPARGPVEVRRVARALDTMASSLAARRAELEEVNRAIEEASRAAEQAAAAAASHGAELEAVLAAMPLGLLILSPDQQVVRVNQAACDILGLAADDLARCSEALRAGLDVRAPDGRVLAPAEQPFARALRGELVRGEMVRIQPGGGRRAAWLSMSASSIRDPSGAVRGAVAALVDVTPLRELQEERETLMQTVSHDLRTPLHVIVSHAEILRRRSDDETRRRGEAILASAGRMTRLIDDLVDATRLEAGHVSLRLEPMDLGAFLAGWRERMAGALDTHRVRLEGCGPVPAISADPARVDQILVNLVSNALKYSLPDSEVRVALHATPAELRLSVADRGPGIDQDEIPRLFERYYRARSAGPAEGLGLGLFITRKLVDAHGWRIEVTSARGEGSVFTLVIPVDPAGRSSRAA